LEETRVQRHENHFDQLWSGSDPDVEVFPFPKAAADHLKRAALKGYDAVEDISIHSAAPRRFALPHQTAALEGWIANGQRGIFEHATGSGKTFTAILAIREHVERGLPTIVLVPSRLLLEQWAEELRLEIPKATLLLAGGGNITWKAPNRLQSMTSSNAALGGRIVLATMPTASTEQFRGSIAQGAHLFLVTDEVHQIGSPENSRFLEVDTGPRLGLSATPVRYGDYEGTQRVLAYFHGVIPPAITLIDAVRSGRLVPYEYYPHPINLTATEAADWKALSRDISLEIARQKEDSNGNRLLSERAKMLLIRRSRIAKRAAKKVDLAREIILREFQEGQHWLIYCEDSAQLSSVVDAIRAAGLTPIEYHSAMAGDRDATMSWFRTFGGPLVSIRCLDEGVDIPSISHALILASSQNPRQFIQRRGRVLRTAPGKTIAIIHDAIVVPVHLEDEPEQTSLLKSELLRAIEFANSALNKMAAAELRTISAQLGFDTEALGDIGVEEDDDAD
jgi:superfamily II DNA or RNA helicase